MNSNVSFQEGDVLARKFRVVRVLGKGGMGVVLEADHLDLERRVAVKLMLGDDGTEEGVSRFFREARAAARLHSPHVAKVLDVGRLDSGAPYLVMELLHGCNLQTLLRERGRLPVSEVADYLLEACEALAEAHAAGIVHRDLKPANLFLAQDAYGDRVVKLLDFGISKIVAEAARADLKLTDSRALMGSPVYMSPEQLRASRDVDHRSDIWSLGAVLFELVSGRVAWDGESIADVLLSIASDPAPSLLTPLPDAPRELDAVIARCLNKDPAGRFQHVADLAIALSKFGSQRARSTLARVLRLSGKNGEADKATALGLQRGPAATSLAADPPFAPSSAQAQERPKRSSNYALKWLVALSLVAAGALLVGAMVAARSPASDSVRARAMAAAASGSPLATAQAQVAAAPPLAEAAAAESSSAFARASAAAALASTRSLSAARSVAAAGQPNLHGHLRGVPRAVASAVIAPSAPAFDPMSVRR